VRGFLRKALSVALFPLRLFGLGSDAYTPWSYREQIVTAVSALSWSVVAIIYALVQKYPPWVPPLFALGAFAVVLALVGWGVRLKHYLVSKRVAPEPRTASPDANLQTAPTPRVSLQEWWRERIQKWRAEIHNSNFNRTPLGTSEFCRNETYVEMEPYLPRHVRERFKSQVGAALTFVGPEHLRGSEGDKRVLLGEVARIEKEWVLNPPEPITKQATPGELKALCFHLADELDDEHRSYLNSEQMVMLWEQELKGQGLSESEIDQKVESTRDDHLLQTLNRYNKHLKGRLLKLHDALGPQGWFGAVDRSRFENLSDPYYMSNLAKRLREVCGKLPDS
jgi:hypothetical protein